MYNYKSFKELIQISKDTKFIWWLNLGVEDNWTNNQNYVIPRLLSKNTNVIAGKSEQMCLLIADRNDVVIMKDTLPDLVYTSLTAAGFDLPDIWNIPSYNEENISSVSKLILDEFSCINRIQQLNQSSYDVRLIPYAVTSIEKKIAEETNCKIEGPSSELVEWINNKVNSRLLAIDAGLPVTEGVICKSKDELLMYINHLRKFKNEKIIIKEAYGASGKGMYLIDSEKSYDFFKQILKRNYERQINVIVEKWYDKKIDINYQIYIRNDGTIAYLPPKKQILEGVIYNGSEFPVEHILNSSQLNMYEKAAESIGNSLLKKGYRGIASIDSIATDDRIYPVVEINGRFSLSTYISFIESKSVRTRFYLAKYYNIYSDNVMDMCFDQFAPEKGEGIIIYSFAEKTEDMPGRIFVLFAYNDIYKLYENEKCISSFFKENQNR